MAKKTMASAERTREDIFAEICERIANGEPLRQICRCDGMPAWTTVYNWINESPECAERIARARLLGADAIAEDIIGMMDEEPKTYDTLTGPKIDPAFVQWQKNRVEQRLKLLAKWCPKKYGDRLELAGDQENPITIQKIEREVIRAKKPGSETSDA